MGENRALVEQLANCQIGAIWAISRGNFSLDCFLLLSEQLMAKKSPGTICGSAGEGGGATTTMRDGEPMKGLEV